MKPQITELIFFHLSEQKNKPKVINKRKTIGEEINKIGNKHRVYQQIKADSLKNRSIKLEKPLNTNKKRRRNINENYCE